MQGRTNLLQKGIQIVEFLGTEDSWTGVREIARNAHLSPATTHRILQSFLKSGWIEKEGTQYRLTGRVQFTTLFGASWPGEVDHRIKILAESVSGLINEKTKVTNE